MAKEDGKTSISSQIEPNDFVRKSLDEWKMSLVSTSEDLVALRNKMFSVLTFRPYDDETKEAEKQIRWRRTGSQVLEDGFVYQGKACTDLVVTFLTFARAGGVKGTRFVKLKNNNTGMVRSVGEFELVDGWYTFDVANRTSTPLKGEIKEMFRGVAYQMDHIYYGKRVGI